MIGCIGHDGDCCKGREQERKDAERYRWLRAANASLDENVPWYVGIDDGNPSNIHWIGSDLDGAIDAAMVGANVELTGWRLRQSALSAGLERLAVLAKRSHYYCEDSWYSCPKAKDGCANDCRGPECDCGAHEHNAEIDSLMAMLRSNTAMRRGESAA